MKIRHKIKLIIVVKMIAFSIKNELFEFSEKN
jgi:hypothetical protein